MNNNQDVEKFSCGHYDNESEIDPLSGNGICLNCYLSLNEAGGIRLAPLDVLALQELNGGTE